MYHFRIVPSGCSEINASSSEAPAQNENKENKDEIPDAAAQNKEEDVDKPEKPEKQDKPNKLKNTTYIFTRYSKEPAVVIPSADHFTVAVRCCPTIFKLRPHENCPPLIDLPYRMVYAVASKSSVHLYDTQQRMPFGSISNIHYARLTDVTWSNDGKIMIVSSYDGFCTLIAFEDGELGEVYDEPINLIEPDDKEIQSKKKRNSNDRSKTSPKDPKVESKGDQNETSTPTTSISTKDNVQMVVKPKIEIPETMIASVETFESPEYKEKQATPIAIRRAPRTNPSTPSSAGVTPKSSESEAAASAKKPKLIAIRRQPRNILPTSVVVEKSTADQDEALDAWPIPIDCVKTVQNKMANDDEKERPIMVKDETEDMHLIYEGESELTLVQTDTVSQPVPVAKPTDTSVDVNKAEPSNHEQQGTPDTKHSKTPRRVQFRTISTPKSKKKLIN